MLNLFRRRRFQDIDVEQQLEVAVELDRVLVRCWDLVNDIEAGLSVSIQLAEEQLAAVQGTAR